MPDSKRSIIAIIFCFVAGAFPLAIAAGWLSQDGAHAPLWVIAATGVVFWLAGCMLLLGQASRLNDALAAVLLLLFGSIGMWVALYGDPAAFGSAGLPVSREMNISIARWMFGIGAVLCYGLSGYALVRAVRGRGG